MDPAHVHPTLSRHQLADGLRIVLDLDESNGIWLHDAVTGDAFFDAFTCFAAWPIGYNHPRMLEPQFQNELLRAAIHKPSNSDLYTPLMASFVEAFATRVTPPEFPYHFWVSGGALAVENALKAAFDWKARKLGRTDMEADVNDLVILHFRDAFHGRSGYTMSLTNTDPVKVGLYPKFDWPRVYNPGIFHDRDGNISGDIEGSEARAYREIEAAFTKHAGKVAAIIIEPIQGEGGDHHFRTEFLESLRRYADENEALLIFDEVQTGFFGTGRAWHFQNHGVAPDIVCFGKKTQVCGIFANDRITEVDNHVFLKPSRINSTWGGNLVDMVRCHQILRIIEEEHLAARISETGTVLLQGLRDLFRDQPGVSNVRGIGSLIAFTLESPQLRKKMLDALYEQRVLALSCGANSIRFRLPLVMASSDVPVLLERVAASLPSLAAV